MAVYLTGAGWLILQVQVCDAAQGQGLVISAALVNRDGALFLDMDVSNQSAQPIAVRTLSNADFA